MSAVESGFPSRSCIVPAPAARTPVPVLPAWVTHLLAGAETRDEVETAGAGGSVVHVRSMASGGAALISAAVPGAADLDDDGLRDAGARVYHLLRDRLGRTGAPHPVRFWNFIPGIVDPAGGGLNRYMHFNLGRYQGLRAWLGGERRGRFSASLPTATGVGHRGADLAVHVLGLATPGRAVENPRQRPAYEYSEKFGPRPPCFSRGTVVGGPGGPRLLIGGTASVYGEDSIHDGSLDGQFRETLENLAAVIRAAGDAGERPLERISEARIYCPRTGALGVIRRRMARHMGPSARVETVRADLCRPELLVEVEAVAALDPGAGDGAERP